jgi:hypothetical protein
MGLVAQNSIVQWFLAGEDRAGTPVVHWTNLPESWGVFVLLAGIAAIVFGVTWLYRHEAEICPKGVRRFLACMRLGVLLLLLIMFLQPTVTFRQVRTTKPTIAVLRDASMSMAHTDRFRDPQMAERLARATGSELVELQNGQLSRVQLLERAWAQNDHQLVRELRDKATVRVIDFAETISPAAILPAIGDEADKSKRLETDSNSPENQQRPLDSQVPPLLANGRGTDIGQALREALVDSNRLSAIVLIGDGQHNGAENPLEFAEKSASLNIPIFTVGVGDPTRPTNLTLTDLYVQSTERPDEPFEIEALLYAQDLAETNATVELIESEINPRTGQPENERIVESREVQFPERGGRVRIDFQQTVTKPGKYVYKLRAPALENEVELADNERASNPLEVLDDQVRVLLVAGAPNWDFQMVQRLLQRDQNINVTCWLQTVDEGGTQAGDERIARLPRTIEEMGRYHVIMLMDPNPDEFDREWIENLKLFCKRKAGGVLYMAGPKFTADFLTLND